MGCVCTTCGVDKRGNKVIDGSGPFAAVGPVQLHNNTNGNPTPSGGSPPECSSSSTPATGTVVINASGKGNSAAARSSIAKPNQQTDPVWDTSKSSFPLHLLPNRARNAMLPFLASSPTVLTVLLVCKDWHRLMTSLVDWQAMCAGKYPSLYQKLAGYQPLPSFLRLYCADLTANLLRNPSATTIAEHRCWRICNGEPVSSLTIADVDWAGSDVVPAKKTWTAAKRKIHRKQVINLEVLGFPAALLDDPSPLPLYISEWFSAHGHAQPSFRVKVRLLGAWTGSGTPQEILVKYDSGELATGAPGSSADVTTARGNAAGSSTWRTFTHCFTEYPKGLRYISFEDISTDVTFTAASVQFGTEPRTRS